MQWLTYLCSLHLNSLMEHLLKVRLGRHIQIIPRSHRHRYPRNHRLDRFIVPHLTHRVETFIIGGVSVVILQGTPGHALIGWLGVEQGHVCSPLLLSAAIVHYYRSVDHHLAPGHILVLSALA